MNDDTLTGDGPPLHGRAASSPLVVRRWVVCRYCGREIQLRQVAARAHASARVVAWCGTHGSLKPHELRRSWSK